MATLSASLPIRLETDVALAQRLEAAYAFRAVVYAEARASLQPELAVTTVPLAAGVAVYAGPDASMSRALGLGMQRAVATEDMERVEEFFYAHRMPPRFELCPLADPSLLELLRTRRYCLEQFWNSLARPLAYQDQDADWHPSVEISRIRPQEEQLWLQTVAKGIVGHENPGSDVLELLAPSVRIPGIMTFLAWVDDEPAGGGAILVHDGIAEFCSAGTRVAFRRRGVQTALLHARIAAAARAGCYLATAIVLPGSSSERNAQRTGFQLAYTRAIMAGQLPDWI